MFYGEEFTDELKNEINRRAVAATFNLNKSVIFDNFLPLELCNGVNGGLSMASYGKISMSFMEEIVRIFQNQVEQQQKIIERLMELDEKDK